MFQPMFNYDPLAPYNLWDIAQNTFNTMEAQNQDQFMIPSNFWESIQQGMTQLFPTVPIKPKQCNSFRKSKSTDNNKFSINASSSKLKKPLTSTEINKPKTIEPKRMTTSESKGLKTSEPKMKKTFETKKLKTSEQRRAKSADHKRLKSYEPKMKNVSEPKKFITSVVNSPKTSESKKTKRAEPKMKSKKTITPDPKPHQDYMGPITKSFGDISKNKMFDILSKELPETNRSMKKDVLKPSNKNPLKFSNSLNLKNLSHKSLKVFPVQNMPPSKFELKVDSPSIVLNEPEKEVKNIYSGNDCEVSKIPNNVDKLQVRENLKNSILKYKISETEVRHLLEERIGHRNIEIPVRTKSSDPTCRILNISNENGYRISKEKPIIEESMWRKGEVIKESANMKSHFRAELKKLIIQQKISETEVRNMIADKISYRNIETLPRPKFTEPSNRILELSKAKRYNVDSHKPNKPTSSKARSNIDSPTITDTTKDLNGSKSIVEINDITLPSKPTLLPQIKKLSLQTYDKNGNITKKSLNTEKNQERKSKSDHIFGDVSISEEKKADRIIDVILKESKWGQKELTELEEMNHYNNFMNFLQNGEENLITKVMRLLS